MSFTGTHQGRPLGRFIGFAVLCCLWVVRSNPVAAQHIRGTVVELSSERPLATAAVTLIDAKGAAVASAMSDSSGRFQLQPPGPGKYWARAQLLGYVTALSSAIEFTGATTPEVTIRMQPRGIPLDTLRVQAERNGLELGRSQFTRRCATTEAICLNQARIRASGAVWPTDLFNRIPGVAVIDNGRTRTVRSFEGWGCFVIFLDHHVSPMQSYGGGAPLMRMDELVLADIVAIEIYKSYREVPRELRESIYADLIWPVDVTVKTKTGGCGVARVWTRAAW